MSRNLGKNIILETREVAKADGVEVSENDCLEMFNRDSYDSRQTNKSSMAFDVLKSRKTEIDFISGAVSKIGKKHGVKTPLNDLMYNIIKIKEEITSRPVSKEIIWKPTKDLIDNSKLSKFIKFCELKNYDELESKSLNEPGWLWDNVIKFFSIKFL